MSTIKEQNKYVHAHGQAFKGKVLMVASSPAISEQTGWPIGFWAAELTHPLHVFQEAGYEVVLASTKGGKIEMDAFSNPTHQSGYSSQDVISLGYMQQEWFNTFIENTLDVNDITEEDFDAIFLVGGQGPMYTFVKNTALEQLFADFYQSGKPSAVVCHASVLLLKAKNNAGELLVKGKTWTGFADEEERYADEAVGMRIQPFWIEEEAKRIPDTTFKTATPFSSYAIMDGNLITGQQQNSGGAVAEMVIELLNKT